MIMNYNDWFFKYNKYLKGKDGYNDNKFVEYNKRFDQLIKMNSELLNEQPFGVISNDRGFDKLLDLMMKSNYTFEDIDQSLKETFDYSLQSSMSRMLVNNQSVMFACNNMDRKHVTQDKFSKYYIIDIPFNQLHFGDRDEFIRQQIHLMYNTEFDNYIDIQDFVKSTNIGFTMLCCVNGFICNDCKIGISDKGFKFKIGWGLSSDVNFIIYKLDECLVYSNNVDVGTISSKLIPYGLLKDIDKVDIVGKKCLVNVYDSSYKTPSVCNFGVFDDDGLKIINLQNKTLSMLKSNDVKIDLYSLKYIHEVPNVYPAINYYDIMDNKKVYLDNHDALVNIDDKQIISSSENLNELEICTPPIILDRPIDLSHKTILTCINMKKELIKFNKVFLTIGKWLLKDDMVYFDYLNNIRYPLREIYPKMLSLYNAYVQGAILTSLVDGRLIDKFNTLLKKVFELEECDFDNRQNYVIDEYYGGNYIAFVNTITSPFVDNALSNFGDLSELTVNYFDDDYKSFKRPVSEQCFISLKYNRDEECWLFDYPTIKHFNGIQNAFYVDDNLKGNEVYKFFVLYTDTESPDEKTCELLTEQQTMDFDLFCNEVNRHMGYMRYWYAENRLNKISKVLYDKYDGETCCHVLSKILKRKINGDTLLDIYPSDISYDISNVTSLNYNDYDELSDNAPLSLNYLFYTLSMLNNNQDKLQYYFYNQLTNKKFENRYADIDLTFDELLSPIDFSTISLPPTLVDSSRSVLPDNQTNIFYGLPMLINNNGTVTSSNMYRYVFNVYENRSHHYLVNNDTIDKSYYVFYENPKLQETSILSYRNDINVCRMCCKYITYVSQYVSDLQTYYIKSFNQTSLVESGIQTIQHYQQQMLNHINEKFIHEDSVDIMNLVTKHDNEFVVELQTLQSLYKQLEDCEYNNKTMKFNSFISLLTSSLKNVFVTNGFDKFANKNVRKLYIHLKKINDRMNCYEYAKWLNEIDIELLNMMDDILAKNVNYNQSPTLFKSFAITLENVVESYCDTLSTITNNINDIYYDKTFDNHFSLIIDFCSDILQNYIFKLYTIEDINIDTSVEYSIEPKYVIIELSADNEHLVNPANQTSIGNRLLFTPNVEFKNGKYYITQIHKICEYVMFDDTPCTCVMSVMSNDNQTIKTINCQLTFNYVSSSSDDFEKFYQLSNISNTKFDFENAHESFTMNGNNIINKSFCEMNYELLLENSFNTLEHTSQMILKPISYLQGSIDRIYLNNQKLNNMINKSIGNHTSERMYVKPEQVLHLTTEDGAITSIGNRYFVGQTVYCYTNDDNIKPFPIKITKISHSTNKGFIEAIVDSQNASWNQIIDKDQFESFMRYPQRCYLIPDNVSNFLQEYNGYNNTFNNYPIDDDDVTIHSLPGDPLYVQNNANYIYTRLNWFFNELIPNRFIDEQHKQYEFIYVGDSMISDDNDIKIKMINHDFNTLTDSEIYPILREEPNDHVVWDEERKTFDQYIRIIENLQSDLLRMIQMYYDELRDAKTNHDKQIAIAKIETAELKYKQNIENVQRIQHYAKQLESPTTWYNVRAYEDAMVYIDNGRAINPSFINNINDLLYSNKVEVFMYDWENKCWLNPNDYTITTDVVNNVKIDESDEYTINNVLHSIKINSSTINSSKVLIYFAYNKSDVYDEFKTNQNEAFFVKFKPILSLSPTKTLSPYNDIRIRKHFNGYEKYLFDDYNQPDSFEENGYYIKRIKRNGKYNSPSLRKCDITVMNDNESREFDLYVKSPFIDVTTNCEYKIPSYVTTINQPIDSFIDNKIIKLICITNNQHTIFDGVSSTTMFECITSTINDVQTLTVINSTLPSYVEGTFVCITMPDESYAMTGGIITITITNESQPIYGDWIKIPNIYKIIPDECIIVPTQPLHRQTTIIFNNEYNKESNDEMDVNNQNVFNPFEYYYDDTINKRYPISNVKMNNHNERLIIDQTLNENVKLIKSTYLHVCRYSLSEIPKDGIIDVTGYIPTPLSRDRYEVWVNGRCIKDLIILSPTTFQLCNLTSLRNLELIELVDDVNDNIINKRDCVYINLNGKMYSSYQMSLLSNTNINNQKIQFVYNVNNHTSMDTQSDVNPNNIDIEPDILSNLITDEELISYDQLYNKPSINGKTINHVTLSSLNINPIPDEKIINTFDDVWKYERITNPLFDYTHKIMVNDNQTITLHSQTTDNEVIVYATGLNSAYLTLYISNNIDDAMDDTTNTLRIIPYIQNGVCVVLPKTYKTKYLHTNDPNCKPIRL